MRAMMKKYRRLLSMFSMVAALTGGTAWGSADEMECLNDDGQDALLADERGNGHSADICHEQWGIKVMGIRRSSAGYMLDFRYRVLQPDKARLLLNRRVKPYLIVEDSGAELQVPVSPKIGPLRQSSDKVYADRNYFMLFGNPGRRVKSGDKVTVVVGDFRATHLVVE
jgi:hypothetical protein